MPEERERRERDVITEPERRQPGTGRPDLTGPPPPEDSPAGRAGGGGLSGSGSFGSRPDQPDLGKGPTGTYNVGKRRDREPGEGKERE